MTEHLVSASMTFGSEQPAPAHLNSVASTPPRTDISNFHTPLDCSVRLQDILASPSPICKRTRMQLRLRQTAVLQVSPDPSDQEGPLDLSPNRPSQHRSVTIPVACTPITMSSPAGVDLTLNLQKEHESPEQNLNDPLACSGYTPPLLPNEIQHTPDDFIETIKNLSITESPVTIFPDVTLREVPDNSNVGKNECDKKTDTAQKSLPEPIDPVGNSHPAIRFENVSSPVQMQQVEYFPFSLRCAFFQRQANDQGSPTVVKKESSHSSPSDSKRIAPVSNARSAKEVHTTEAAFLQHICSPSPSRSWTCVLCGFVAKKRRGLRFHMKEKHNTWKVRINAHGLPVANLAPAVPRTPKARAIQFQTPRHDDISHSKEAGNPGPSMTMSVKRITPCVVNLVEFEFGFVAQEP
ncbi:hypothetical protein AVEN_29543-1 [Araneus ventricosus]|uniref:Uncharacterized protein n=1 Tax=Araneus ventricosus TaxID=182803 RepID=A0A4Y2WAZ4_ARAVE|nr:hypothetical protein AVEN_29543-1 [Araneus ventricosus]